MRLCRDLGVFGRRQALAVLVARVGAGPPLRGLPFDEGAAKDTQGRPVGVRAAAIGVVHDQWFWNDLRHLGQTCAVGLRPSAGAVDLATNFIGVPPLLFEARSHDRAGVTLLAEGCLLAIGSQGKKDDKRAAHDEGREADHLGERRAGARRKRVCEDHGHAGRDVREERGPGTKTEPDEGDCQDRDDRERGVLRAPTKDHGDEARDDADGGAEQRAQVQAQAHEATRPAAPRARLARAR